MPSVTDKEADARAYRDGAIMDITAALAYRQRCPLAQTFTWLAVAIELEYGDDPRRTSECPIPRFASSTRIILAVARLFERDDKFFRSYLFPEPAPITPTAGGDPCR